MLTGAKLAVRRTRGTSSPVLKCNELA